MCLWSWDVSQALGVITRACLRINGLGDRLCCLCFAGLTAWMRMFRILTGCTCVITFLKMSRLGND